MTGRLISISGTGCCLVDQIYPDIDFSSPVTKKYMSRTKGDGGLHPGRLVFSEQFEDYASKSLDAIIEEISLDSRVTGLTCIGTELIRIFIWPACIMVSRV